MNCQLPATGGADLGVVIVATTIIVLGVVALVIGRRMGGRAVLPVLIGLAVVLGVVAPLRARAADDCVTTTAATTSAIASGAGSNTAATPPSTAAAPTAPATTVDSSISPTSTTSTTTSTTSTSTTSSTVTPTTTSTTVAPPTTTIPSVRFCTTLIPNGGTAADAFDIFVSMDGGQGTYSLLDSADGGCGGGTNQSGPIVDSDYLDPAAFCLASPAGPVANQAAAEGTYTPQMPASYFYCSDGT